MRQAGHPAAGIQLSGLAAQDARDAQIMMAALVVLSACSIGFGAGLRAVAGHRPAGPWLVRAAGAAAVAAGAFRRDHMLRTGPGLPANRGTTRFMTWQAALPTPRCSPRRWRWRGSSASTRSGP